MERVDLLLILLLVISLLSLWYSYKTYTSKQNYEGYGCDQDQDYSRMCGKGCNVAPGYATPAGWKCCYTADGYGPSCTKAK